MTATPPAPAPPVRCADCGWELRTPAERVTCDVGAGAPVTVCYRCAMLRTGHHYPDGSEAPR